MSADNKMKSPAGPSRSRWAARTRHVRSAASYAGRVAKHCWRRSREHNAMAISASLAYRTIFALVPAIVLAFLVLKAAGVVENGKQSLRQVLDATGLSQITVRVEDLSAETQPGAASAPAGPTFSLAEKIEGAVDAVEKKMTFARLGPIGLLLMAWSAITLLTTMERALNRIFEARRSRPLLVRVLLYWSAFTLMPVVLLAAGFLAAKATQFVSSQAFLAGLLVATDVLGNLLMGIVVLGCIYRFLPNTSVAFRSALIGAAVIVPLWILARWGFSLYVSNLVAKGSVYGALGLLPLFLIWVNLCWYGFLMGAEVAYTVANLRRLEARAGTADLPLGALETLSAALAIGGTYLTKERPATVADVTARMGLPEHAVRRLLDRLAAGGIISAVVDDDAPTEPYVPTKPLGSILARDVLALGQAPIADHPMDEQLALALNDVGRKTQAAIGDLTLLELLKGNHASA